MEHCLLKKIKMLGCFKFTAVVNNTQYITFVSLNNTYMDL